MKHRILCCLFLLVALVPAVAQTDSVSVTRETDVIRKVENLTLQLITITSQLNRGYQLNTIESEYDAFKPELELYMRIGNQEVSASGINRLQDFILILERLEIRLDEMQEEMAGFAESLSSHQQLVDNALSVLDSVQDNPELLPEVYRDHVNEVYEQLIDTRALIQDRSDRLIELQINIAEDYVRVLQRLARIREYRDRYWERLFSKDTSPTMYESSDRTRLSTTSWRIVSFFQKNPINTVFFLLVIAGIYYLMSRIRRKDAGQKYEILYRTRLASACMLGFLLFPVIFPPTTTLMYNFMLVAAYIPFLFILWHPPFKESYRSYLVFFLTFLAIRFSAFYAPMIPSLALKVIYLLAAVIFLVFLLNKKQYNAFNPRWKIALILLWILKFLLVVAFVFYLTDRKILAKILIESVGDTIALGTVILYIGFWLDTLIDFLKDQPYMHHLHSSESEIGWQKWHNFTRLVLLILFLVAFAHYLHIDDYIAETISTFLTTDRNLGSLTFDWGGILLFFLVLYISSKLAGWIKFFTSGKAIYGSKKRTSTVSTMIRFGVILAGFLLALFVSGIPLDKITIILGALSVGLGFGLQNIVNNLVSGIILIFERPIQVGDMVNVKSYTGIVKDIGIRASIVRTFDGAEVIIPNGHLISEEVINWTLSDQHRRVEVIVGVAYGSDVDKVQSLLEELLSDFKGVLKLPKPVVLFQEFGDSSLNFSLRFWVSNIDDWLLIKSEMTSAVYHAFNKAGIEIPFPQRDLHIKSVRADDLKKAMDATGKKK